MSLSVGGGLLQSGGSWSHPAAALRCCRHGRAGVPCLSPFILLPWVLHSVALDAAALFCGFFLVLSSFTFSSSRQHRTRIAGLTFSPDGNFMFSSCLQGTLALYSCVAQKSQVLRVLGKSLGFWAAFFILPLQSFE